MEDKSESPSAKRRRASRAGQARRFECKHPGCEKRYSRAEHLQRHSLNHAPRQIYRCEVEGCGLTFVRADLFARHKARHEGGPSSSIRGHGRSQSDASSSQLKGDSRSYVGNGTPSGEVIVNRESSSKQPSWNAESEATQSSSAIVPQPPSSSHADGTITSTSLDCDPIVWPPGEDLAAQTNDNFAAWLFESPGSHDEGFNLASGPFVDFGLDYSPKDMWDLGSLTVDFEVPGLKQSEGSISETRKDEITSMLSQFLSKQRGQHASRSPDHMLYMRNDSFPNLTIELLDKFAANFWQNVSVQMSIVHQPTFSSNACHLLLLLAIISLGAADLVKSQPKGYLVEYKELADLIMSHLRWEIFTNEDADPPVQLWVAQTLLLLEFYEKQWSTRRLHERAHIHHASTLTLLRRGSPLVGRTEDETPPSGVPLSLSSRGNILQSQSSTVDSWWMQWVRNESFNRVVFAAFMMDTLHALMYGHGADMAPYEIRTNLPCDDSLWAAKSADEVQKLDANLKMYGLRPTPFLEGLKQSLHAQNVQTHSAARMLLMSGLLSVGWHVNRREKHLQFLETAPSIREQGRWRSLLLNAFGHWRSSFDEAIDSQSSVIGNVGRDKDAATVLFHLAHMTMHADLIGKHCSTSLLDEWLLTAPRLPDFLWNDTFVGEKGFEICKCSSADSRSVLLLMP